MTENTATATAPALNALAGEILDPSGKDWTYLQTKAPSSVHELHAATITRLSGVEVSAKQVQAMLAMHRYIQKSEANRKRPEFHGRTWGSVVQGAQTLEERALVRPADAPVNTAKGIVIVPAEEAPKEEAKAPAKPRARRGTAAAKKAEAEKIAS